MRISLFALLITFAILFGCEDEPAEPDNSGALRLVLTADTTEGAAPLTVHFTGTLYGDIDKLEMCVTDVTLCPGFGKTCISYCTPDTSQPAKRTYSAEATYVSPGDYKAVMRLNTIPPGSAIYSDSMSISVLP